MLNLFNPKIKHVFPDRLKKEIDSGSAAIILDVRTKEEYDEGKIKGSINVPVDNLAENIGKAIPDKSARVYVYCLSGTRSAYATGMMMKLGYSDVSNMAGGVLEWRAKGFLLE